MRKHTLATLSQAALMQLSPESRQTLNAQQRAKQQVQHRTPDAWVMLDRFEAILARRYPAEWSELAEAAREPLLEQFARCGYVSAVTNAERQARIALVEEFERRLALEVTQ